MKRFLIPIIAIIVLALFVVFSRSGDTYIVTSKTTVTTKTKTSPKTIVYLENSGSMDGYMTNGAEIKDAIYSYVSAIDAQSDTLELNYINSVVIPFNHDLKQFIQELTPQGFRASGGNRSNSDIALMLNIILQRTNEKTISIFISDCILDVPNGNALDYFTNRQIDINRAFSKKLKAMSDLAVEVFQLESTFTGTYFYTSGNENLTSVKRPYYMLVIGKRELLANLNEVVPFTEIKHGIHNYTAFTKEHEVPANVTNQHLTNNSCDAKGGKLTIKAQANLSSSLQDESYLSQPTNYSSLHPQQVKVSKIERTTEKDGVSHIITIDIDNPSKIYNEEIMVVKPYLPEWVEKCNDDSGTDIKSNLKKTTGIKYIIGGIADAYKEDKYTSSFTFNLKRK